MNNDTKDLIGAAIRTNLVGLPSIPGLPNFAAMIVQGWTEYENNLFKNRVGEFFTEIRARLESVESLQVAHLERILSVEAQTAILEESVAAASREPSDEKRQAFANFYVAAITGNLGADADQVRSLLHCLEAMTPSDLKMLSNFLPHGICTGDTLSNTWMTAWEAIGGDPEADHKWDEKLAPVLLSVTKLETRGLIVETRRQTAFQHSGDAGSWYNQFRRKAWRITKPGRQLLQAISQN